MSRGFIEAAAQQEGGIAPHQAVETVEEEAMEIGAGRKLAHVFNIFLPTQERCGSQSAVLRAVIDVLDPGVEPIVQLVEREPAFGIEVGQELLAHGAEAAFNLAAPFGLIGARVNDQGAERGGDAPVAASGTSWRCRCRGAWVIVRIP